MKDRNQRNNEAVYARTRTEAGWGKGDAMCNVTALAMALNQVGIGVDESSKQLEDVLSEDIVERYGAGNVYMEETFDGQAHAAAVHGAQLENLPIASLSNGTAAQTWFEENVRPRLEKGEATIMGIYWGADHNSGHIVRLEWVEDEGLRVDDPYGRLRAAGSYYTYDLNDSNVEEGAVGADNLWDWETVADVASGRYVRFVSKAPATA